MGRTRIDPHAGREAVAAATAARREGAAVDRSVEGLAVRYLTQLLAERAPGRAVEVRIPPYSAVQAGPGPSHRRGTPPAVVETDPGTWLDLATGALGWAQARAAGRIRASGQRADLSAWLPLLATSRGLDPARADGPPGCPTG